MKPRSLATALAAALAGCSPLVQETSPGRVDPYSYGAEVNWFNAYGGTSRTDLWAAGRTSMSRDTCVMGTRASLVITHWDGSQWRGTPVPSNVGEVLHLRAVSRTEAYAIAAPCRHNGGVHLLRWDGAAWTELAHAEGTREDESFPVSPSRLQALGPGNAWFSPAGLIAHWDGSALVRAPALPSGEHVDFVGDGASSGYAVTAGQLLRLDRGAWTVLSSSPAGGAFTGLALAGGTLFVGTGGGVFRLVGAALEGPVNGPTGAVTNLQFAGGDYFFSVTTCADRSVCINPVGGCGSSCSTEAYRGDASGIRGFVGVTHPFVLDDGRYWMGVSDTTLRMYSFE